MFSRLLLLFIITPMVELYLLLQIGAVIGLFPTLGIILLTGFVGAALARREGLSTWMRFQAKLQQGGLPGQELADGMIILVSAAFLLTPGVLTDVIGFLGLLPPTRALIRRWVLPFIKRKVGSGGLRVHTFGSTSAGSPFAEPTGQTSMPQEPNWGGQAQPVPQHAQQRPDPTAG